MAVGADRYSKVVVLKRGGSAGPGSTRRPAVKGIRATVTPSLVYAVLLFRLGARIGW